MIAHFITFLYRLKRKSPKNTREDQSIWWEGWQPRGDQWLNFLMVVDLIIPSHFSLKKLWFHGVLFCKMKNLSETASLYIPAFRIDTTEKLNKSYETFWHDLMKQFLFCPITTFATILDTMLKTYGCRKNLYHYRNKQSSRDNVQEPMAIIRSSREWRNE